ncbi:hypothetical protein DFP73DRAFT_529883 [Morchella snyderi]|nr:hypothetical protein DFP73DRAFT_529883 [Morchella snyderi]
MPAYHSRNPRGNSPDGDEGEAVVVWPDNLRAMQEGEYVHPYFAVARAGANTQVQQAEGGDAPAQVLESGQAGETRDENRNGQNRGSQNSGGHDEADQVYAAPGPDTLMECILRWDAESRRQQDAEPTLPPFGDEEAQLGMPPRRRGLSAAHIAIYSSRPPTPHPLFEGPSYPENVSPNTGPSTPPNQGIISGDTVPHAPRRHIPSPPDTPRADSPAPSSGPSECEPDPACGVCYRRSVDIRLVGCSHGLCATCTRRTYFASQKHSNHWPSGIDCPFCRRLVQIVKPENEGGRLRRLPLWVVRWSVKGRRRVMRAHPRTVEPEQMRGWVGFMYAPDHCCMQNAIMERRYPPLKDHGAASTVVVAAPAPSAEQPHPNSEAASEGKS